MTQKFRFPRLFKSAFVSGAIAANAVLIGAGLSSSVAASFQDSPKATLDEAWQIVNRSYVDPTFNNVDWSTVRTELLSREYSSHEEAYVVLRQALQRLDDPYTRFMTPDEYQALINQTSGELSGIGIRLQMDDASQALTILEPIPNSPAMASGVQPGDRLLAIDGQSTEGMSVQEASALIRGEEGTSVILRLSREATGDFELSLTRQLIELPAVQYSLREEDGYRIGYIRLSEFSSHAAEQMQQAIQELSAQKAEGFVLDLRGNPGGLLQASIDISRMWLDSGSIVRTVNRELQSREVTANHTALTEQPLAVLVDGYSASSSEILTGALMDNRRATVVGTQTFGKALVQSVHSLSDGSGIAVTIAHYYTPAGTDISHLGIAPDVEVVLTTQQRQVLSENPDLIATPADPQYMEAVTSLEPAILVDRVNALPTEVGQTRTTQPN